LAREVEELCKNSYLSDERGMTKMSMLTIFRTKDKDACFLKAET
jgi:hypothetical protein